MHGFWNPSGTSRAVGRGVVRGVTAPIASVFDQDPNSFLSISLLCPQKGSSRAREPIPSITSLLLFLESSLYSCSSEIPPSSFPPHTSYEFFSFYLIPFLRAYPFDFSVSLCQALSPRLNHLLHLFQQSPLSTKLRSFLSKER